MQGGWETTILLILYLQVALYFELKPSITDGVNFRYFSNSKLILLPSAILTNATNLIDD